MATYLQPSRHRQLEKRPQRSKSTKKLGELQSAISDGRWVDKDLDVMEVCNGKLQNLMFGDRIAAMRRSDLDRDARGRLWSEDFVGQ